VGSIPIVRPFKKSKQTVARIVLPFVGSIFSDRPSKKKETVVRIVLPSWVQFSAIALLIKVKKKDSCEDCSPFVGSIFSDRPSNES
jgi:hypothetical protein